MKAAFLPAAFVALLLTGYVSASGTAGVKTCSSQTSLSTYGSAINCLRKLAETLDAKASKLAARKDKRGKLLGCDALEKKGYLNDGVDPTASILCFHRIEVRRVLQTLKTRDELHSAISDADLKSLQSTVRSAEELTEKSKAR